MKHYCGLFATINVENAHEITRLGLHALQHRGEESAGICFYSKFTPWENETRWGKRNLGLDRVAGMGLVSEAIKSQNLLSFGSKEIKSSIGHVRYSTTGNSSSDNIQPMFGKNDSIALAHNGNLTNASILRNEVSEPFTTTTDTEVILRLFENADSDFSRLGDVLMRLEGAYCLLFMTAKNIVAIRDPKGFRPLSLGRLGDGLVIASETVAFEAVGATFIRDINPGEIYSIETDGSNEQISYFGGFGEKSQCIFEQVYFADPASNIFGQNVHIARYNMGRQLGIECPVDADLIVPIPHSGIDAAMGYADQTGIPLGRAFTTNNYAGRSFIMPEQNSREAKVHAKLHVIREAIAGKRICVIEDSVVRGTTTGLKMKVLRDAGATEVHLRIASSPIRHPCYFGIDFPDAAQLIATNRDEDEIAKIVGVDSIGYISVEGMKKCVNNPSDYCAACFTGVYPLTVKGNTNKQVFEKELIQ